MRSCVSGYTVETKEIAMCTMVYSVNSHRKIVHHPHCSVVRRIPKGSRRAFDSFDDVQAHGYRLCNCCPSIAQKYRKERSAVAELDSQSAPKNYWKKMVDRPRMINMLPEDAGDISLDDF